MNVSSIKTVNGITTKFCRRCSTRRTLDEFHNSKHTMDGLQSWCKICRADLEFIKHYKITIEDYEKLYKEQRGLCKICGCVPNGIKNRGKLHVDHDHKTGKIRGLLCANCNIGIGHLQHSLYVLVQAFNYLESFEETDKQTASNVILLKQKEPIK